MIKSRLALPIAAFFLSSISDLFRWSAMPGLTPSQIILRDSEQLSKLLETLTPREIGEHLGVTQTGVKQWMNKHGLTSKVAGMLTLTKWCEKYQVPYSRGRLLVEEGTIGCVRFGSAKQSTIYIHPDTLPPVLDSVCCRVCNASFEQITDRHLRTHGISTAEYRDRYPDSDLVAHHIRIKIADQRVGKSHTEETKAQISKNRSGISPVRQPHSEATRARISAAHSGKTLSTEHRNAISLGNRGRTHSEATKKKMSTAWFDRPLEERARIRAKIAAKALRKYGVENHAQAHIPPQSLLTLNDRNLLSAMLDASPVASVASELGVHQSTVYNYARKHDVAPTATMNSHEKQIADFLDELSISYKIRDRRAINPFELDFLLADYRLAIEYNGLFWHADGQRNRHRDKLLRANAAGLRLIMINEDEWRDHTDAVKSRIANVVGRSPRGVGGRQLVVRNISNAEAARFCDKHHIQGRPGAVSFAYGAFLQRNNRWCNHLQSPKKNRNPRSESFLFGWSHISRYVFQADEACKSQSF